jgi:DNA-binding transcriptional ArsR family regulator
LNTDNAIAALIALAQDSRLAVYRLLVLAGPAGLRANKIAERLSIPPSSLSFHLKELAQAAMITPTPEGRNITYAANFATMDELIAFLTENCCLGVGDAPCSPPSGTVRDE